MALPNQNDEFEIPVGISGEDKLQADIDRVEKIISQAAKNINQKFGENANASKVFNQEILKLEKAVVTLTRQYAGLGKAGKAGFEEIEKRQKDALLSLTVVLNKLRDIDIAAAEKGAKKSLIADLQKQAKALTQDLQLSVRELLALQQLDIVTKAKLIPEAEKIKPVKAYTGDVDLERQLRAQDRAAFNLEKQLNELSRQTYAGSNFYVKQAKEAQQEIGQLTARINQLQRVLKKTTDRSIIEQLDLESKSLQRQLGQVESRLLGIRRVQLANPNPNQNRSGVFGALQGIADIFVPGVGAGTLGAAAGVAAITYGLTKFVDYGKLALDKYSELIRANRLLESSAIEAGIGIGDLTKKNREFANLVGLSDVAATGTVAKIAQLTTRSQRPEDIDKLVKGFANLSAARGLNPTELETIVQQIITGQDEGYKKLGLPNPSELYRKYGQQNNRSAESLTSVERAQIFQTEFLKKAELFNGAAEARINSLDGAVSKLYASVENLGFSLAKAVASSPDVVTFIDDITAAAKRLTGSLDELSAKQVAGTLTEADINEVSKPGALSGIRKLLGLVSVIGGKGLSTIGYFDETAYSIGESVTDYGASELFRDAEGLNRDAVRRRLNAQKLTQVNNERIAAERKIDIARLQAEEDRTRRVQQEQKRYNDLFKKRRDDPAQLERALQELEANTFIGGYTLNTGDLEKRVNEQYSKLTATDFQQLAQSGVTGEEAIKAKFRTQAKAEMEAALEVLNQPLFDEATKENLIERGQQELSTAVQKMYNRVLADPHIKIQTVLEQIGQIEGDQRLFPEVQEALLREAKAIQERMAKVAEELTRDTRNLYIESAVNQTGNPLIRQLADVEDAIESTRRRFAPFGKDFAEAMAEIAKADALSKVEKTLYNISDQALRYRQEARKLERLPDNQTDAFARRLETVERTAQFVTSDAQLRRQFEESRFYSDIYSPYSGKTFLQEKYGYTGLDRLTQDFQAPRRNAGESGVDYQKRINEERRKYLDVSIKIKDSLQDLKDLGDVSLLGTGIYGQEALAKFRLERLPSVEELLPRLSSYGETREEARNLLKQRTEAQGILREANLQKFRDFIANQQFIELNRTDAQERLDNLERSGLNQRDKLQQYLNITGELGTGELTPAQRQGRINVLNQLASLEEKAKREADERLAGIASTMESIKKQIQAKGLKVDLGDQAITEINVTSSDVSATSRTRRSGQGDVNNEY